MHTSRAVPTVSARSSRVRSWRTSRASVASSRSHGRSEVDSGFSVTHRPTALPGRGPFRHGAARPTDPCRAQRGRQNFLFWANLGRKNRPTDPKICKTRVDRLNFPTDRPFSDRKSPVGPTRPTDPPVAHPGTLKPESTSLRPVRLTLASHRVLKLSLGLSRTDDESDLRTIYRTVGEIETRGFKRYADRVNKNWGRLV